MSLANIARRAAQCARALIWLAGACLAAAESDDAIAVPHALFTPMAASDSVLILAQAKSAKPAGGAPAALPVDPDCLTITQSSTTTYMISNTACAEQSVLTSIELATGNNAIRCFTKKIRTQISIASEHAAPVINYQCIEGAQGCTAEILRTMFPECRAG